MFVLEPLADVRSHSFPISRFELTKIIRNRQIHSTLSTYEGMLVSSKISKLTSPMDHLPPELLLMAAQHLDVDSFLNLRRAYAATPSPFLPCSS